VTRRSFRDEGLGVTFSEDEPLVPELPFRSLELL